MEDGSTCRRIPLRLTCLAYEGSVLRGGLSPLIFAAKPDIERRVGRGRGPWNGDAEDLTIAGPGDGDWNCIDGCALSGIPADLCDALEVAAFKGSEPGGIAGLVARHIEGINLGQQHDRAELAGIGRSVLRRDEPDHDRAAGRP